MSRVLVTGSSGFIGTHLCRQLSEQGYSVTGVDLKEPRFSLPDSVETRLLDLTTSPELPDVDTIVHLAAHSQVQPIVENPEYAIENVEMTKNVLEEANRMDAAVVHTSSRDVYGNAISPSESEVTSNSPNPYAASKLGAEAIANAYNNTYDVPVTSLRLSNVYGPQDMNQRVIPTFISLADSGDQLQVFGEKKLLDFIYIEDVCKAVEMSIRKMEVIDGEVINIGFGIGKSLVEVADRIAEAIDTCPGWEVVDDRSGDVSRYVSDISKAKALLNWEPSRSLNQGLEETIEWYRSVPK